MGQVLFAQLESWQEGVWTSPRADLLPPTASPRGRNSYLVSFGAGTAVPAKREGFSCENRTAVTGTPTILGQLDYKRYASGTFTTFHLLVSDGGRLDRLNGGTAAAFDSGAVTPFSSGTFFPDFALANNLAFIVNGQSGNNKKATVISSTNTVQTFGLTRPTVGTMAGAAGAAGSPDGTYALRVTYYNGNTGHESSASDTATATVTVASQRIDVSNIPTSADTQVTARRLYVRNTATQALFYLAGTVNDNVTTTATLDFTDASLITAAPDTEENNPPPTLSQIEWHQSRMFAVGPDAPSHLLFSKPGLPEAFDPEAFERVNPDDGQVITALHSTNEILLIFKRDALYALYGDNPASWQVRLIDPEVGCVSHRSIVTIDGVTYWWSEQGPMRWNGSGLPEPIATDMVGPTVSPTGLNYAHLSKICAAVDEPRQHIVWAFPEASATVNTGLLVFNYRLQRWVTDLWDPFDIASLAVVVDGTTGVPWVMAGGYEGQVFKLWGQSNDGVASGTTSGTFTPASGTITTLTDTTATFDTTGQGLIERYVRIYDRTSGAEVARRKITANTATALTIASTTLTSGALYGYEIGGPAFEWDTAWIDHDSPFWKKRLEYLYIAVSTETDESTVYIDLFLDDDASTEVKTFSFNAAVDQGESGVWDVSEWDEFVWGGSSTVGTTPERKRVARTCRNWRVRVRNRMPDEPVTLLKLAMRAELMTDRR